MCGITGIAYSDPQRPVDAELLRAMNATLRRRGPDDEGFFIAPGIGLAMRRLSIIDVAGGRQPMASEDGAIQVVCNGEIYNFPALRDELIAKGHTIHSRADTAILPHAYEEWGEAFLDRLEGMFALAVWDGRRRSLLLARDRLGKKPLYFAEWNGGIYFGSELKALMAVPELPRDVDRRALLRYLSFEYLPAPDTILSGMRKLPAATALRWESGRLHQWTYWSLPRESVGSVHPEPVEGSNLDLAAATERFWDKLQSAVRGRLVADVPLGVFLSGGIDSSSIVAAVRAVAPDRPLKTFAIAFDEPSFDESSHAALVARKFDTEHHVERLSAAAALEIIPDVVAYLDEPLADASILPTYLLSRFARRHVTVALGGDGGDELFAGYPTFIAERVIGWYRRLPLFLRERIIQPLIHALPTRTTYMSVDFRLKKLMEGIDAPLYVRHTRWVGTTLDFGALAQLTGTSADDAFTDLTAHYNGTANEALLSYYLHYYLPEDVLTKVDRASMATSLEVRAPFCDHRLVEWVWQLPFHWKLNGLTTKYFLKRAMADRLPKAIVQRTKKGFSVPTAAWLRGPLRPWMHDLLAPAKLRREGFFDPAFVERLMAEHLSGRRHHQQILWALLMFEEWLRTWR